jgi:predicted membrane channel-forming protein YqfA (hemolysin III family)
MRPSSIVNFERVVLLSLGLGVLNTIAASSNAPAVNGQAIASGTLYAAQAIALAVYLLLLYFISRKASPVAKWIYVVLTVLGLVVGATALRDTASFGTLPLVLTLVQYVLSLISLWLLFRPESRAWFNDGRGEADSDLSH